MWSIISKVLQAASVIPAAIKAINQLLAAYYSKKNKELDKKAFEKLEKEKDQRELEERLFNTDGGKRSNIPGTDVVDELPNVLPHSESSGDKRDPVA